MTPEEAFAICRISKGAFPATTMDEFTPEAWSLALEDDNYEDARLAIKSLMRQQTFIHVSDIVAGIQRIRRERLSDYGHLPPPPADLDDIEQAKWLRALRRRIADGEQIQRPELAGVEKPKEIDFTKVFRSVDEEEAS